MAGIDDLGIGTGYLYIVEPDKTTIVRSLLNDAENARNIKLEGVKAQSIALNRKATATATLAAPTGVGTITSITVNGREQMDIAVPIAYTGATIAADLAVLVVAAINNFSGVSVDCTATSVAGVTTIVLPQSTGDTYNGTAVVVTSTGFLTYTSTAVAGGSTADQLYDTAIGYTFFINADYDSSGCGCSDTPASPDVLTNAIEITDYIVNRSLTSAIDTQNITIATDAISFTRKSLDTLIYIDTEAAAGTDNLFTISVVGFAEGDKITLRGVNNAHIVTVVDGTGNIQLQGAVSFVTAELETALVLQLKGSIWYEVSRTTQALGVTADYRTAGFGFFGIDTFTTAVLAAGTVTYNGGTASKFLELTGTVALAGNATYTLGTGVNGDEFILQLNAATTIGGFALNIFGITLTAAQALRGGLIFQGKYVSAGWQVSMYPNLDGSIANPYLIPTELYAPLSVDVATVEANLATEIITRRVSFETGEICANKITMGYPGSVTDINFSVDKVIAGTDNGTITAKNNAGAAMTGALITVTAASALDTVVGTAATITGNNTFIAGDVLSFTTAKTTVGGFGTLSIKVLKS